MSEATPNIILDHLRAIRAGQEDLRMQMHEIKDRLGRLERQVADLHPDYASLSIRLDRLDSRVERIERRLSIADS